MVRGCLICDMALNLLSQSTSRRLLVGDKCYQVLPQVGRLRKKLAILETLCHLPTALLHICLPAREFVSKC